MLLEPEARKLHLEIETQEPLSDNTVKDVEEQLAERYALSSVRIIAHEVASEDEETEPGKKKPKIKNIIGGEIKDKKTPMRDLNLKLKTPVIEGEVFGFDCHETRQKGKWIVSIQMTDYTGSVNVTRFIEGPDVKQYQQNITPGMWLRVTGRMELSRDGKDIQMNPSKINSVAHEGRKDDAPVKRVELHLHTQMSNMDALTDTKKVVSLAASWGMPAIAITDHGVAQAFPDASKAAKGKIKILYGCEGYFVNNLDDRVAVHGTKDGSFSDEIVCFDIETTGLKVTEEAITEIGAVLMKNGKIVDTFQTFVDPERRLSPNIVGLTGITDEMLRGAPKLEEALRAFLDFAGDRILAAHNAEFDIGFIRAGCKKCGIPFEPTYLDSLIFAQNLIPNLKSHKLNIVADALGLPEFNHHRASDDAVPVAQMLARFFKILEQRGVTNIQSINDEMMRHRPEGALSAGRHLKHIILIARNSVGLKNLYKL
ncbi:MAG: PHP domain-containing protein, partial [Oscillospiraceae bacterium]|nr:PHP domain-containing protein [Oscillospiraceae bacterium]